MDVYDKILRMKAERRRGVVLLIDPDRYSPSVVDSLVGRGHVPDLIFVGGSVVLSDTETVVSDVKRRVGDAASVILFPGDYSQLAPSADALLFLSLVSGRNPEYLIGQHVKAAHVVKRLGLEVIPTAYMLIDGGRQTSVQYVSSTMPLPADKPDLAAATALAAEMLGMKMIYLEAGSGALNPVRGEIIGAVRASVSVPLIVGGGLRDSASIDSAFASGADFVVVGTAIERQPELADIFW